MTPKVRLASIQLRWLAMMAVCTSGVQSLTHAQTLTSASLSAYRATQSFVASPSGQAVLRKAQKQVLPVGENAGPKPVPAPVSNLPKPLNNDQEIQIVRYGKTSGRGNQILLTGGAEIVARGYRCLADTIEGNRQTEIFKCSGNVRILGADSDVIGESVTVNFKDKTFFATYGKAQIKPNLIGNQITSDAYLSGAQSSGNSERIKGKDCEFTTCEYDKPHFHLDSRDADIEPSKQVIFKQVKIIILGKTLVTLPILWIPLGDRSYKYLPQIGQTIDEGYYIKNTYGFPMRGEDRGAVRLDYMQRLGTGIGANYFYRNDRMSGIAKAYAVAGNINTVSLSNQHEQKFGSAVFNLDNDIQKSNYLIAPESSLLNTRATLRFKEGINLGFSRQVQSTAQFSNENQVLTFNGTQRTKNLNTNLDLSLSKSAATGGVERQTLDVKFQSNAETSLGTAGLEYQRTIPIGEVENFFPASDRTPFLSLRSTSKQLFGDRAPSSLPFRTELSLGEFLDPIQRSRVSRGAFELNYNRAQKDSGPWKWDSTGSFRQNVYSDDTAQYRLQFGNNFTYQLGKRLTGNLRHNLLRPFGYSPLAIDRTGTNNFFTFDLSFQTNRLSTFGFQTGYDVERGERGDIPWQQVGIRSEYLLGNQFSFRTLSTYDTFRQAWSNLRLDATWQTNRLSAALGARYDAVTSKWASINAYLDGLQYGRTRIGAVLNYNGFTNQFDSQQYNLTYDLHCFEALLTVSDFGTGFRSGREIGFFIRIKSIPFDSNFGSGRRGQVLGSGTGRDF